MLAFVLTAVCAIGAPPVEDVPVLYPLEVRVAPWADVYLDDELVAPHATQITLHVLPGPHTVELRHPLARAQRRALVVPDDRQVVVRLEPLPAFVVVKTPIDADVVVAGTARGRSWTSEVTPLAVDVPQWRAAAASEIRVRRAGFADAVTTLTLRAGETTVVDVELTPDDAPAAAPARAPRAKIPVERVPSFRG